MGTADKCTSEFVQVDDKGKISVTQTSRLPDSKKECKLNQCDNLCKKDARGNWIGGTVTMMLSVSGAKPIVTSKCDPKFSALTTALTAGQSALNSAGDALKAAANAIGNGDAIPQDVKDRLAAAGFDYKQVENIAQKINENPEKVDEMLQALASGDQAKAKEAAAALGLSEDQLKGLRDNVANMTPEKMISMMPPEAREAFGQLLGTNTFGAPADAQSGAEKPSLENAGTRDVVRRIADALCQASNRQCDPENFSKYAFTTQSQECPSPQNCKHASVYVGWHALTSEGYWGIGNDPLNKNRGMNSVLDVVKEKDPELYNYLSNRLADAQARGLDPRQDFVLSAAGYMGRIAPIVPGIQAATSDFSQQAGLAMWYQLNPTIGNRVLTSSNPEAIWGVSLDNAAMKALSGNAISGVGTVGDAVGAMLSRYNGLRRGIALVGGEISEGLYRNPVFTGYVPGSDVVQRRYGSPFASLNPFNSSVYSNDINGYAPYAYSAPVAQPTGVGYPASAVQQAYPQSYQQPPYTSGQQPQTQLPPPPPAQTPAITPVATLIAPMRVSRGGTIVLSWSSIGMMRGIPCVLSETVPENVKLAESNGGEYRVKVATSSTASRYSFTLKCTSAADASAVSRNASVVIE